MSLGQSGSGRLEGLCGRQAGARIRSGRGGEGIERLEAHFTGQAFAPHRHDTYAIGVTLSGVQTFFYRGAQRHCLPGQGHVLHPDETHDGAAATDDGFSYRIAYVDPALVQAAIGGRPLPFVADPVVRSRAVVQALACDVLDMDDPVDEVRRTDLAVSVAAMLAGAAAQPDRRGPLALPGLLCVREMIAADPAAAHPAGALEAAAGLDRWTLARQFRAAFGTSPSRFRIMRRLDRARQAIRTGSGLAEAALEAGFADQSHMSRLFKRAYGLTPARWAAALAPAARH